MNNRLTGLFFSCKTAVENVKQCPDVLMVDATYTTNIFGYTLINVIGISIVSCGKGTGLMNISIALCWVADETKETYIWFFETLKEKVMFLLIF